MNKLHVKRCQLLIKIPEFSILPNSSSNFKDETYRLADRTYHCEFTLRTLYKNHKEKNATNLILSKLAH